MRSRGTPQRMKPDGKARAREPKKKEGRALRPYRHGQSRLVLDMETGEFRERKPDE